LVLVLVLVLLISHAYRKKYEELVPDVLPPWQGGRPTPALLLQRQPRTGCCWLTPRQAHQNEVRSASSSCRV
jgi:hypothetical protein